MIYGNNLLINNKLLYLCQKNISHGKKSDPKIECVGF